MQLHNRLLGHRLGERVDVSETHRIRMDAAALDELVLYPPVAQTLSGARHRGRAGRTHPRAGLTPQSLQDLRASRLLLHGRAKVGQHRGLVAPVEAGVVRRLLANQAAKHSADVRGRDMDEMRPAAGRLQSLHHACRSKQIRLCGEVRGVVELHGCG